MYHTLETIQNHINTIPDKKWQELLNLVPEIEKKKGFGKWIGDDNSRNRTMRLPYIIPDKIVIDFVRNIHELNLVIAFDWTQWKQGNEMLRKKEFDPSDCTLKEICMFFTLFIRVDRFNEGFLVAQFEDGNVLKLLKQIKNILSSNPK